MTKKSTSRGSLCSRRLLPRLPPRKAAVSPAVAVAAASAVASESAAKRVRRVPRAPPLPSGGKTLLEGCNVTLLRNHNASATLFGRAQLTDGATIMINNQMPDMPLGVDGPSVKEASWVLVNNHFARPELADWNRLMLVLQGTDDEGTVAHLLDPQDSDPSPVSGLLFSGGRW